MKRARYGRGRFALECVWADSGKRVWIFRGVTKDWAQHLALKWRDVYALAPRKVRMRVVRRGAA